MNENRTVSTRTTVRVTLDINCEGGSWTDDVSLAKTHADAVQGARNILNRIFRGEPLAHDVASVRLSGIESLDVHVIVKERG